MGSTAPDLITNTIVIAAVYAPDVTVDVADVFACDDPPFDVTFNTTVSSANVSYDWDFGNGETALTMTGNPTYTAAGNYDVKLIFTEVATGSCIRRNRKSLSK